MQLADDGIQPHAGKVIRENHADNFCLFRDDYELTVYGLVAHHDCAGWNAFFKFLSDSPLQYKYGNRHFWCRGYYVSTVGANRKAIQEYIRNQLQEDYTDDQMSIKEYVDPFTGQPITEGK